MKCFYILKNGANLEKWHCFVSKLKHCMTLTWVQLQEQPSATKSNKTEEVGGGGGGGIPGGGRLNGRTSNWLVVALSVSTNGLTLS